MVWNMAGEFISLKNMTSGSNKTLLVGKAAFHSSPSFIQILLYPHWMSSSVKYLVFLSLSISLEMSGSRYWFLTVIAFNF